MESLKEIKFLCPQCGSLLAPQGSSLACHKCHKEFTFQDEVIDLSTKPSYWNLISKEEMEALISQARSVGWARAIRESKSQQVRAQYSFTDCPTRADPTFYLALTKESRVLDIGAGWGNFAFAICPRVKQYVAADISAGPLKFIALRAKQDNRENILPVRIDPLDYGKLPFETGAFDAVILNGVLEWIGSSVKRGNPLRIQRNALKEARRVLKKNGQVFIGIENRLGSKYFFGYPDDHLLHYSPKGLSYTTLMPRFLASLMTRIKLKIPYRTYTHSLRGYKRLLDSAGFRNIQVFWPDPDYRAVTSRIVPVRSRDIHDDIGRLIDAQIKAMPKASRLINMIFGLVKRSGIERWFCNSYMIIGDRK